MKGSIMTHLNGIKFLLFTGFLFQINLAFSYPSDFEKQGRSIMDAVRNEMNRRKEDTIKNAVNLQLIEAVINGKLTDFENALNNPKVDINFAESYDEGFMTALMWAVRLGRNDFIKLLLNKGANPHIEVLASNTALREAVKKEDMNLITFLFFYHKNVDDSCQTKSKGYGLIEAVKTGKKEIVAFFLDNNVNPNIDGVIETKHRSIFSCDSSTSLIAAIQYNYTDIIKMLIKKGANVNYESSIESTSALITAVVKGNKEIVALLLENGANTNHKDIYKNTALMAAVTKGNKEIVALLLDNGADPFAINVDGHTALSIAKRYDRQDIIKLINLVTSKKSYI